MMVRRSIRVRMKHDTMRRKYNFRMNLNLSVIIATYNSEKTLENALNSLLNQTYKNFEVIIIDGLSTDLTVTIIKKFQSQFFNNNISYQWISEKDSGVYEAWNKGIKLVNSKDRKSVV